MHEKQPLNEIGVKIDVSAEKGTVDVGKWVEGDLSVRAGRLTAKMIKGHRVRLQVRGGKEGGKERQPPLVVEALYGRQASVLCTAPSPPSLPPSFSLTEEDESGGKERGRGSEGGGPPVVAVDIGRSHGALKVVATGGGVRLGGVNGSAVVQTGGGGGSEGGSEGGIDVRFEALEPGCANVLATQGGPINLLVVRFGCVFPPTHPPSLPPFPPYHDESLLCAHRSLFPSLPPSLPPLFRRLKSKPLCE